MSAMPLSSAWEDHINSHPPYNPPSSSSSSSSSFPPTPPHPHPPPPPILPTPLPSISTLPSLRDSHADTLAIQSSEAKIIRSIDSAAQDIRGAVEDNSAPAEDYYLWLYALVVMAVLLLILSLFLFWYIHKNTESILDELRSVTTHVLKAEGLRNALQQ
jgi:hypothetical protein